MSNGKVFRRGIGVLAVVAVVSACSSSKPSAGSSTTTTGQATSSSSAAATGAPIKVGLICTCSGPFGANILGATETYKAWVSTVNASGGLGGHPIQLTSDDDAMNPGTSASDAQALIAAHVDVIVDVSVVDQVWASAVQSAGIPVVGANESEVPFYTNPDFYSPGQTNDSVTYANAATAKVAGATNLGDLYCAEAAACQQGVAPLKAAGAKLGVPVIYNAEISATAPSYTAQCVAAQQQKVSGLFIGDGSVIIARVAQDCHQQGYDPIYITEGEGYGMNMASAPGLSKNLWSEYGDVPFFANTPAVQAMNAAVDKSYPGLRSNTTEWTNLAVQAWASGLLLRDAVQGSGLGAGGTPSPAAIIKGLESLHGDTLDGMSPPLTYAPGQPHPVDCWFTARVQNGTPALAEGGRLTCQTGSAS